MYTRVRDTHIYVFGIYMHYAYTCYMYACMTQVICVYNQVVNVYVTQCVHGRYMGIFQNCLFVTA